MGTTPEQYKNFEDLTKGLLRVPKESLDKKVATYNAKKSKKRASRSPKP